jgi:hypothetical protein
MLMKKLWTLLFLTCLFIKAGAAIINPADSVYASGNSCNITVEFFKGNKATAFIEGKTRKGTIYKDGHAKGEQSQYYYFAENGKKIFFFLFSEGQMIILNQQYQYECEDAKGITLNRVIKKPAAAKPIVVKSAGSLPYAQKHLPGKAAYQTLAANIKGAAEFLCDQKNLRYLPLPAYGQVKVLLVPMDCGDFNYRYYLLTLLNNKIAGNLYVEGEWYEPEDDTYKEYTRFSIDKDYKIQVITDAAQNGKTSLKSRNTYQLTSTGALKKL